MAGPKQKDVTYLVIGQAVPDGFYQPKNYINYSGSVSLAFYRQLAVLPNLAPLTARMDALELTGGIWQFIGDPGDNNLSQGPFDTANSTISGNQNTFYGFVGSIEFGPICNDNRLEANVFNVKFGTRCSFNHIGAESVNVQFGDNCQHNDIGADIGTVTFGHDCQYNTIGASCTSIVLGDSCTHITMTPQCSDIVLGDGCQRLTFINCNGTSNVPLVIPAGTTDAVYRNNVLVTANAGGTALLTGPVLYFDRDAEYQPFYSGTFTVDTTGLKVGATVRAYLGPACTAPTLPATFQLLKGAYASGVNLMYSFCVGANGKIQYYIDLLP